METAVPAVLLLLAVALLVGIVFGLVRKQWLLAAACAVTLMAGAAWIVRLLKGLEWTYLYAGTRHSLEEIARELQTYHEKNKSFPPGLKIADLGQSRFPTPEAGWGYILSISEHSFRLTSWARDGKPGGSWYDQDIVVSWKAGDALITTESAPISP